MNATFGLGMTDHVTSERKNNISWPWLQGIAHINIVSSEAGAEKPPLWFLQLLKTLR